MTPPHVTFGVWKPSGKISELPPLRIRLDLKLPGFITVGRRVWRFLRTQKPWGKNPEVSLNEVTSQGPLQPSLPGEYPLRFEDVLGVWMVCWGGVQS